MLGGLQACSPLGPLQSHLAPAANCDCSTAGLDAMLSHPWPGGATLLTSDNTDFCVL